MSLTPKTIFAFGAFELKLSSRTLSRAGEPVALGSKAFEVLTCLVAHAGEVVSKDELLKTVWPESFVEESNLAQHVFALRRALGPYATYIKTVPGRGYQFIEPVRELSCAQGPAVEGGLAPGGPGGGVTIQHTRERALLVIEPARPPAAAGPEVSPEVSLGATPAVIPVRRRSSRLWMYLLIPLTVLAVTVVAAWRWFYPAGGRAYQRVVLADFVNSTGDPAFDRSLKRALEIDLEQSPHIGVMSGAEAVGILKLMGHKSDDPMTPEIAREVCERGNRDVLLAGEIARVGRVYLLTLEATDCRTGKPLASAKAKANEKEEVLSAVDTIADRMRSRLGESSAVEGRFETPIAQVTTPSLEALKAFSIAESMRAQGEPEAGILPYYQHAIELDPQFAMAYVGLGTAYYNLSEMSMALENYRKAFALRQRAGAKESLIIEAHYYADGLRDIEQGIETYKMWAAAYPFDTIPWANLANDYTQIGQYPLAIEAGERALQLGPDRAVAYVVLMRAYRRQNRLADAKSLGMLAIERGKGGLGVHAMLYEIARWEQDQDAIRRELAWGEQNPGSYYFLYDRAESELFAGRYREAVRLFEAASEAADREGLSETADLVLLDCAQNQIDFGRVEDARAIYRRIRTIDPDSPEAAMVQVGLGNLAYGRQFLDRQKGKREQATMLRYSDIPQLRATLAMSEARPLDAVAALEPSRPYDLASLSLARMRGEAYLMANEPTMAEAEFQKVIDHYGVDVISPEIPFAHLGLARAYSKDGRIAQSRREYETLFAIWKDADPDLPPLSAARREYARLAAE